MCYHTLYLFLTCGHSIPSRAPLAHTHARSRTLFDSPSLASPIFESPWATTAAQVETPSAESQDQNAPLVCSEKLSHPLHTYRIAGLCLRCEREREERLARFEVGGIKDGVEREVRRRRWRWRGRDGEVEGEGHIEVKIVSQGLGLRSGYVEGRGKGERGRDDFAEE